jgi:aminoglycoside 2'-N-acetyltransferase I
VIVVRLTSDRIDDRFRADLRALLWSSFDHFTEDDWEHTLGGVHVVAVDGRRVTGHAAVVPRRVYVGGEERAAGYVEGVAVAAAERSSGVGSAVMREAGGIIADAGQLGVLSTGAHGFYRRLGWERWRGPSFVIEEGRPRRTADEDDGIMVLRGHVGGPVDLTSPIAVDARSGDDW